MDFWSKRPFVLLGATSLLLAAAGTSADGGMSLARDVDG